MENFVKFYSTDAATGEVTETIHYLTPEEIAQYQAEENEQNEKLRAEAYKNESDPLFFKWQRGEATQQEWLDKVNEIKQRYPKV